jgi:hypothetical protein
MKESHSFVPSFHSSPIRPHHIHNSSTHFLNWCPFNVNANLKYYHQKATFKYFTISLWLVDLDRRHTAYAYLNLSTPASLPCGLTRKSLPFHISRLSSPKSKKKKKKKRALKPGCGTDTTALDLAGGWKSFQETKRIHCAAAEA